MSERQEDTGWWLASDGKWYPPESHPSATASVDASEGGTRYAGFWLRFWAFLIDVAILAIATGIITGVLGLSGSGTFGGGDLGPRDLFEVVAFWLYVALMESSGSQATVGKMALSLRVTDISGERLTFGRASGRTTLREVRVGNHLPCRFHDGGVDFQEAGAARHDGADTGRQELVRPRRGGLLPTQI